MKGTEQFKETIKCYLDQRAKEDELFRAKYETTSRTIDDVVTYILNAVFRTARYTQWRYTQWTSLTLKSANRCSAA